jgi:hypothetical protein
MGIGDVACFALSADRDREYGPFNISSDHSPPAPATEDEV